MSIISRLLCRHVCYFCGMPLPGDRSLCRSCIEKTAAHSSRISRCSVCSYPFFAEDGECPFCRLLPQELNSLSVVSYFTGIHKELLYCYKSGRMKNLRFYYAGLLHQQLRILFTERSGLKNPVIIPVPPRKGKMRKQGWDQVALLCRTLRKIYGYPVFSILERTDSLQQKSLNLEDRLCHLEHTIRLKRNRNVVLKKADSIILLDDVFTTGATLSACAARIKEYTDIPVTGMVLCSVL